MLKLFGVCSVLHPCPTRSHCDTGNIVNPYERLWHKRRNVSSEIFYRELLRIGEPRSDTIGRARTLHLGSAPGEGCTEKEGRAKYFPSLTKN